MKSIVKSNPAATLRAFLLGSSLLVVPCVHAVTLYWDGTDSTANADGGTGAWNLANSNWDSAATGGATSIWNNATPDIATFGGTAGTVTLGSTIIAGGLTFNHGSGTYTIAGSSSSNVLSTGAVTITTTAGGTTNITATMFQTGTLTISNAGALSIDSMILGAASTLSSSTTSLTVGSITAPIAGQTFTLRGAGGGEVTGIISLSTAGVTKNDTGTWTLSSSKNIWTGTTTITAGTLKLGVSNALGFGTNALSIANAASAVLDLNGFNATVGTITAAGPGGTITNTASSSTSTLTFGAGGATGTSFTGQIKDTGSGKVALTKVGSATMTLNGSVTNAFTGGINVNGGVLTLDFANMATPTDLFGNTNTLGFGGGSFRVTGKATATTNQTLGNVTVNAGGGQILATNNSGTNLINLTLGSLTASAAGGSLLVGTTAADTTGLTITTTTDKDAQGIYGGRTVFFNGTANTGYDWATTVSGSSPYTLSAYSGYAAAWSTTASANVLGGTDTNNSLINNSGTATVTTTLTGAVTTNTLKIANTETNGTQTLAIAGQSLTLTGGGLLSTGSRAYTISGTAGATRLTAGNGSGAYDLVVHQYNSSGLTISAVIGDNGANATSLTKAGGQALTLSGTNTFTGRTYLTGGTLTLSGSSTTAGTTMVAGTILNLGNSSGLGSGDLTMNGGTFNNTSGGAVVLINALNISGDVTFNSSNLNNITQQTGAVTLAGNNIITVSNNTVTLNGNVGGTGGFFKQGNGILTLGGTTNNYSGPTMINAGTLNINSAITSDQLVIMGGTVNLGASNVLASNTSVTVDGPSSTVWSLGGFNQTIGTLTLGCGNGGAKVTVSGISSTLTLTGGIVTSSHNSGAGGNITVSTLDLNNATQNFFLGGRGGGASVDEISISSVVQNGGINIVGTGATTAVTLSNANTYSGATSLNLATLRLGHLNALQNSPLDTMGTGTVTLAAGAGSYTLGGITGSKNLTSVITGTPTNLTTLVLNPGNAASYSYSGAIGDLSTGMAVTKNGAGTQVLTGTNTYTGATNITNGTLTVSGTGSINNTTGVTIGSGTTFRYNSSTSLNQPITNNGGTIAGSGKIGVAVALDSLSDTLAPGNSPGIQEYTTSQTWTSFTYNWEVNDWAAFVAGTNMDQIQITGSLNLDGASYALKIFSLTALNASGDVFNFAETSNSWTILTTTTGISNFDANEWTINTGGFSNTDTGTWSLATANGGNDLVLSYTAVPEPGSALIGGLGMLLLLRRRRD